MAMSPNPLRHIHGQRLGLIAALLFLVSSLCLAQDRPSNEILNLEASVSTEVVPDLAVVVMSVQREGQDTSALTQEVDQVLGHALADAKSNPAILAASGGYSTGERTDNRGQRTGWQVRASLILKSKDFAALGRLAARLAAGGTGALVIVSSNFEVSPELRLSEEGALVERGVAAFKSKAAQASRAFGYSGYVVREVTVGAVSNSGGPRPMMHMAPSAASAESAPMPIEGGRVTLQLTVHGSVQMHH